MFRPSIEVHTHSFTFPKGFDRYVIFHFQTYVISHKSLWRIWVCAQRTSSPNHGWGQKNGFPASSCFSFSLLMLLGSFFPSHGSHDVLYFHEIQINVKLTPVWPVRTEQKMFEVKSLVVNSSLRRHIFSWPKHSDVCLLKKFHSNYCLLALLSITISYA